MDLIESLLNDLDSKANMLNKKLDQLLEELNWIEQIYWIRIFSNIGSTLDVAEKCFFNYGFL